MRKTFYDQVVNIVNYCINDGIAHLDTIDEPFTGSKMNFPSGSFHNFSLCDYLGLSVDQRLKDGAIKAIEKYGVYTAISRSYMKLNIYKEAEERVSEIFGKPTLLVPRTTLGHIAALPVITDTNDAILLDHQVHTSVRNAADMLKSYGNYTETIRHNNMDILEQRIIDLKSKHDNIWYLADGIYSMHGDKAPLKELHRLMNLYPQFHLYIDDAHGMSWMGERGQGFVLAEDDYHPQMFVATSLGKAFGSGGGALVCPNKEIRDRIAICGAPLIFTSPVTPATLGAIIASVEIHQSDELPKLQAALLDRIHHFYNVAAELKLPVLDSTESSIFFIATGKPDMTSGICRAMLNHGHYITGGVYPAVPVNNSGVRAIVSLHQTNEDITDMLQSLRIEYDRALDKRELSVETILKYYRKK